MNTTSEERKEILSLALKHSIGLMAPVIGPIITDILFGYQGRIKQKRINDFVEQLEKEFIQLNLDPEKLKNEETADLLENIFRKVSMTRSSQKRQGFKNILLSVVREPSSVEACDLFSDILLSLKDKEIEILKEHVNYLLGQASPLLSRQEFQIEFDKSTQYYKMIGTSISDKFIRHPRKPELIQADIIKSNEIIAKYKEHCTAISFNLEKDEYKYFLQDLSSKGLLSDDGVGTIGTRPLEVMSISEFGRKFLNFLSE